MISSPDQFYARIAFYLSLGFWIPLFNIALCTVAVIVGSKALSLAFKDPKQYGGRGYAIAALVLGLTGLFLTVLGLLIYVLSPRICASAVCSGV